MSSSDSSPAASSPASPPASPEVRNITRSVEKKVRSPIKNVHRTAPNIYNPDNDWQVVGRRRRSQTSSSEPESPAELHLQLDSEDEFPKLGSPEPCASRPSSPHSLRSSSSRDDPFTDKVEAAVKER